MCYKHKSDLIFNYDPSPFAFWITRRSQPEALPVFDTRANSLPTVPTGPVIINGTSTILDAFPFVFEKQYLQVGFIISIGVLGFLFRAQPPLKLTSALPFGANVYGLGEVVSSSGFRRHIGPNGGSIQTMWARDAADPLDENM